jgi:exopolysaccharide biosynthesis WecB/TagA/CpsF family protein
MGLPPFERSGERVRFGNIPHDIAVNIANRDTLFQAVRERFAMGKGFALATLNLDHLTKLPDNNAFLAAYQAHELVVADGHPIVWLSRIAGENVDLLPGSDIIKPLCVLCAELKVPVALVGSSDAALTGAATTLQEQIPGLEVCYSKAPAYGFEPNSPEADEIFAELVASGAGLCLIALGAPKQELFAARGRAMAPSVGFVSIGAGLDFLSGHQIRAPKLMRMLAMEWLWRALQSPSRMVPRYLRCFAILPGLVVQALRQRPRSSGKT